MLQMLITSQKQRRTNILRPFSFCWTDVCTGVKTCYLYNIGDIRIPFVGKMLVKISILFIVIRGSRKANWAPISVAR